MISSIDKLYSSSQKLSRNFFGLVYRRCALCRSLCAYISFLKLLEVYVWGSAGDPNDNESHYRPPNANDSYLRPGKA